MMKPMFGAAKIELTNLFVIVYDEACVWSIHDYFCLCMCKIDLPSLIVNRIDFVFQINFFFLKGINFFFEIRIRNFLV